MSDVTPTGLLSGMAFGRSVGVKVLAVPGFPVRIGTGTLNGVPLAEPARVSRTTLPQARVDLTVPFISVLAFEPFAMMSAHAALAWVIVASLAGADSVPFT